MHAKFCSEPTEASTKHNTEIYRAYEEQHNEDIYIVRYPRNMDLNF